MIHLVEFSPKIVVLDYHVPEPDDCFLRPVQEAFPRDLLHLRTAGPEKLDIGDQFDDLTHQDCSMGVPAGFAGDDVNTGGLHVLCRQLTAIARMRTSISLAALAMTCPRYSTTCLLASP